MKKKRLQHVQATSMMRDFDDVSCRVTIAHGISPFGSHLNSVVILVTDYFLVIVIITVNRLFFSYSYSYSYWNS